jgi:hypothetical protein
MPRSFYSATTRIYFQRFLLTKVSPINKQRRRRRRRRRRRATTNNQRNVRYDIVAQFKGIADNDPDDARRILSCPAIHNTPHPHRPMRCWADSRPGTTKKSNNRNNSDNDYSNNAATTTTATAINQVGQELQQR